MEKKDMLEMVINHYSDGNKAKFASFIGISPQALSMCFTRNSYDAELIFNKCEGISGDWLLSGEGEMLVNSRFVNNELELENIKLKQEITRLKSSKLLTKDSRIYNVWMKFMEITSEMQELYKEEKGGAKYGF